ncbi:MAG TPA: hypothetical protein VFH63_08620 [candidate division Zixibacteria bacterium]|nr:hypothetical protein [candidate division Zixibacteria bacterium]
MHIPLPWAIALAAAAALGVVVLLGIGAHLGRVRAPERALANVAHLLGGGIVGFLALAFPPAWPVVVPIAGVLLIAALRDRRIADVGMALTGLGAPWVLLLGTNLIADAMDPAVVSSQDSLGWFAFGSLVLVGGLVVLAVDAVAGGRRSGR